MARFSGLRDECARSGHAALCEALEPVLFNEADAPAYKQIGQTLEMSEIAVKVAAHRIRQRLKGIIREEVLQTVTNANDLQDELGYLQSLFVKTAAHL